MRVKQILQEYFLVLVFAVGTMSHCALSFAAVPTPGAEIVSVKGKGEYRVPSSSDWRPAVPKVGLGPGSLVRAGQRSVVNLLLSDQTQQSISDGMIEIQQVADAGRLGTVLKQNSGKSWGSSKNVPANLRVVTPSASGLIRGTDWQVEVAADGSTALTVFSGEVELANDKGSIRIFAGEQGRALIGVEPTKIILANPRDRVQWVSSFSVDLSMYREFDGVGDIPASVAQEIASLLAAGEFAKLDSVLEQRKGGESGMAVFWLLQADLAIMAGDLKRVETLLEQGGKKFPADERFDVLQARAYLFTSNLAEARSAFNAAQKKSGASVDVQLLGGDLARYEGNSQDAMGYFSRALNLLKRTESAAGSKFFESAMQRALLGIGRVLAERENVEPAREALHNALALNPGLVAARSELGMLEMLADRPWSAQEQFNTILRQDPQDFVALTGAGLSLLKQGKSNEALEPLLAATLIEPRYARAHMAMAVTYHLQRRLNNAIFALARAKDADPNDPMPFILEAMILSDRGEYGRAIGASRNALQRMPFLKSLNQISVDQKGQANLGSHFAAFGLENWARSYAMDSYAALWAASHLFMADRYSGDFNKKSELFQGFLSDPTVFGASNRYSSLVREPGHFSAAALRAIGSDEFHLQELTLSANGYVNEHLPVAYFGEVIRSQARPGSVLFDASATTYTLALGVKPSFEAGLFMYANLLDANVLAGSGDASIAQSVASRSDIAGRNGRVDIGGHWRLRPESQMWLKLGSGNESSRSDNLNQAAAPLGIALQRGRFMTTPRLRDMQFRHTFQAGGLHEISWGAEWANANSTNSLLQEVGFHYGNDRVPSNVLLQGDSDISVTGWISNTISLGVSTKAQLDLAWQRYAKSRNVTVLLDRLAPQAISLGESYEISATQPRLGISTKLAPGWVLRGAYQQWVRPASVSTLAPVATAGMALDDSMVFPGGTLTRKRLQMDWEANPEWFIHGFADMRDVQNLWSPLDGVLNTRADVTNLDRVRQRDIANLADPDRLEAPSVFRAGRVNSVGLGMNRLVSSRVAVYAALQGNDSYSKSVEGKGLALPYVPREQLALGFTAAGKGRTLIRTQLLWRSGRYSDESNLNYIAPNWDVSLNARAEAMNRAWLLEGFISGPLNRPNVRLTGMNAVFKF